MEELAMKESKKRKEREEFEREREQYNAKLRYRNSIETQKESSYKQYYDQFRNAQDTLQGVYKEKTAPKNDEKERAMQEFLKK